MKYKYTKPFIIPLLDGKKFGGFVELQKELPNGEWKTELQYNFSPIWNDAELAEIKINNWIKEHPLKITIWK